VSAAILQEPAPETVAPVMLTSLSVKQVSVMVNIPVPSLYQLIERGEFPGSKLGGRVRIWRRQLINWLVTQGAAADEAEAEVIIGRCDQAEAVKPRRRVGRKS